MTIGIIVYSNTGQTLALVEALQQKLASSGKQAAIEKLEAPADFKPGQTSTTLVSVPSVSAYGEIVLATPTWGGRPAPPMAAFLEQLPDLQGKRVVYVVTGFFPPRMGCNETIAQMKAACEAKGAASSGEGSLSWLTFGRKKKAAKLVEDLAGLL